MIGEGDRGRGWEIGGDGRRGWVVEEESVYVDGR